MVLAKLISPLLKYTFNIYGEKHIQSVSLITIFKYILY